MDVVKLDKIISKALIGLGFPDSVRSEEEANQIRAQRQQAQARAQAAQDTLPKNAMSDENATYARLHQQVTDRGPWQQTHSGRAFFLGDPRPEEVHFADIAHALSNQCRYNGHSQVFYSVAQHAVKVSEWMQEDGLSADLCFAGLHHDSAEAYTGDIVSQVKFLVPAFRDLEDAVEDAVFHALGIDMNDEVAGIVKEYDLLALSTERRDILSMNTTTYTWGDIPTPHDAELTPWSPGIAKDKFVSRHLFLERARLTDG